MRSFDFIESVGKAYTTLWEQRIVIATLALPVFLFKLALLTAVFAFDLQDNFLRQGLLLLPADFFEGILIAIIIRLALFNEHLSFRSAFLVRSVMAGTALYLLLKLFASGMAGIAFSEGILPQMEEQAASEGNPLAFLAAFFIFVFLFWAFRLMFIYVPVVMGWGIKDYLSKVRGYGISFVLMATWLLCFIPVVVVMIGASDILSGLLPGDGSEKEGLSVYRFAMLIVQVAAEIVSSALIAMAVGFGLQNMMEGEKP